MEKEISRNTSLSPLRTIGRIMADLKLSGNRMKKKSKGVARYLCYPEHTIYTLLGGRVLDKTLLAGNMLRAEQNPLTSLYFLLRKSYN